MTTDERVEALEQRLMMVASAGAAAFRTLELIQKWIDLQPDTRALAYTEDEQRQLRDDIKTMRDNFYDVAGE